ncbi:MAG: DUF4149 domain-containing protein [Pseudomonadota bacterium]
MAASIVPGLAFFFSAMTIGAMLFFGAATAPVIFKVLGEEKAGPVVRAIFPRYYLVLGILSVLAAAAAFVVDPGVGFILGIVGLAFFFSRQVIMPKINALRDEAKTGSISAQSTFDKLHSWSVRLNYIQLIILVACFWVLVLKTA